jgi:2-C-methyl-D-erythritol 4-phosphate cytidylyltransferase/2-C-methyl-D-erythritol 2,4-cyclodiphosphate synthase
MKMGTVFALILAGGVGNRFGHAIPKQYHMLNSGVSVIHKAIDVFIQNPCIQGVFAVIHEETQDLFYKNTQGLPLMEVRFGGTTRMESVRLGLEMMAPHNPDYVLVHDGARPFVSKDLIQRVIDGLSLEKAVIPGIPIADTVKRLEGSYVGQTIDRSQLVQVQTPQGFHFKTLQQLHAQYEGHDFTDDASLFEAAHLPVLCVAGHRDNLKITTREDLA